MNSAMRIIVTTSNKYDWLLPGFAHQFNKYWGSVPVTVVCYKTPPKLPENFEYFSLGAQKRKKVWTQPFNKLLTLVDEPYILLLLDDYWLVKPIVTPFYAMTRKVMEENSVDKCQMSPLDAVHVTEGFVHWNVVNDSCHKKMSLQPSIWRREYLIENLNKAERDIWHFEIDGGNAAVNDGATVWCATSKVYKYANIMKKGEVSKGHVEMLSKRDRRDLKRVGAWHENLD